MPQQYCTAVSSFGSPIGFFLSGKMTLFYRYVRLSVIGQFLPGSGRLPSAVPTNGYYRITNPNCISTQIVSLILFSITYESVWGTGPASTADSDTIKIVSSHRYYLVISVSTSSSSLRHSHLCTWPEARLTSHYFFLPLLQQQVAQQPAVHPLIFYSSISW